jgi:hypothetical protein
MQHKSKIIQIKEKSNLFNSKHKNKKGSFEIINSQYKFRAECFHDVMEFQNVLHKRRDLPIYIWKFKYERVGIFPELDCEFETNITEQQILDLMNEIDDSHMMSTTLKLVRTSELAVEL